MFSNFNNNLISEIEIGGKKLQKKEDQTLRIKVLNNKMALQTMLVTSVMNPATD